MFIRLTFKPALTALACKSEYLYDKFWDNNVNRTLTNFPPCNSLSSGANKSVMQWESSWRTITGFLAHRGKCISVGYERALDDPLPSLMTGASRVSCNELCQTLVTNERHSFSVRSSVWRIVNVLLSHKYKWDAWPEKPVKLSSVRSSSGMLGNSKGNSTHVCFPYLQS